MPKRLSAPNEIHVSTVAPTDTSKLWIDTGSAGGGGVTDHGALTGLADDDHTQYHNDTRGDARYYQKSEVTTLIAPKVTRVVHGATASTARPAGATYVEWVGSVEPTNAVDNDTWIDTA